MSFKVVSTYSFPGPLDRKGFARLGVVLVEKPARSEEEIISVAHDADAVIVMVEPFTRKVIENLRACRLIITPKVGFENIDITAATEHGICVANMPALSAEEVSDHTMALLLACARKLHKLDNMVRSGKWQVFHGLEMQEVWRGIVQLREQTLGLIGFGQVSRALVPKAKAFGLRVLAHDPYCPPEVMNKIGVASVELGQLLKESDYVSLHAPLTPQTRHMLGLKEFQSMKPTAYFINAARGALVDEEALYVALARGCIAGAGLDVLEVEPVNMDNPLLKLDNVIFTGHSAHYSDRSWTATAPYPVDEVGRVISGQWPKGWVNPEVKSKYVARWGRMSESRKG